MTKVSVIIPVYNVESYLTKCLDSVLNQTLRDIEIICINDGSTDNSAAILLEYKKKDNRIVVVEKKNTGAGATRNIGIDKASGEYIGFVDPDDWVDVDYFEKLYIAAKENNADIARTSYVYEYANNVSKRDSYMDTVIKECFAVNRDLSVNEHSVVCWNAVYKTEFLKKNNIRFPVIKSSEDVLFTAQATFFANRSIPVAGNGYHYLKTRPFVLSDFSEAATFRMVQVNKLLIEFINSIDCPMEDYLVAFHRGIWRMDAAFQKALNCKWFNKRLQKKFFNEFCQMYCSCKYLKDYKNYREECYLKYLEKKDYKSYLALYKKNKVSINYLFSVSQDAKHKVITILGIKVKIRIKN